MIQLMIPNEKFTFSFEQKATKKFAAAAPLAPNNVYAMECS